MLNTHRKTRVNVRFGCDCIIDGNTVKPVGETKHPVIIANIHRGRRRKNGTIQKMTYTFKNMIIDCSYNPSQSAFYVRIRG